MKRATLLEASVAAIAVAECFRLNPVALIEDALRREGCPALTAQETTVIMHMVRRWPTGKTASTTPLPDHVGIVALDRIKRLLEASERLRQAQDSLILNFRSSLTSVKNLDGCSYRNLHLSRAEKQIVRNLPR